MTHREERLFMSGESPSAGFKRRWLSRREFFLFSWFGLLGVLAFRFFDLGTKFSTPTQKNNTFGGVFNLGPLADLPGEGEVPLAVPQGKFWLVHTEAGLLALHKVCTHLDCLCDWNSVTENFVCPCHGSEFGLDGNYQKGPAGRSLDRFVIRLVNDQGEIIAETDTATGEPLPVPEVSVSEEGETTSDDVFVEVDTGQKIRGKSVVQS